MKVPEREARENKTKNIFKRIIAENFLDLMKNTNLYIQEIQWTTNRVNVKTVYIKKYHIQNVKAKDKDKILESEEKSEP